MASCWGIAASVGMEAQVRALAVALGVQLEMKHVQVRAPFVWLPNVIYAGPLQKLIQHVLEGDVLMPPYPDLVISCGRRAAIAAMGLRARYPEKTKFIHIQDPQVNPKHFDLVIAMEHDRITGPNVIKTRFALHTITPEALAAAKEKFAQLFLQYPKPHVAVLLGGSTNKYRLTQAGIRHVIGELQPVLQMTKGSLLITPSRRTGVKNIILLDSRFHENNRVYVYNGSGENPYMGMLAMANTIIVSNDSVNMMSEAVATGKPVYILPLPGHTDTKPSRFAEMLMRDGIARPLAGKLESWKYEAGGEMERVVKNIKNHFPL